MDTDYQDLFEAHVSEVRRRWEAALAAERFDAAVIHSGTPMYSFLDDYEYAFRPNPHFLWWLPLTHHSDSVLLIRPGRQPLLYYYQPDDYWYLPPSDPEGWWADRFDIEVVRQADDWIEALRGQLPGLGDGTVAAIGDAPVLQNVFDGSCINPKRLVDRIHVERTRKTPYEVAVMQRAARLAARAHVEAEKAFREGESEYGIHMRYLQACRHTDTQLPYNNIVALNAHGAVLHYQQRDLEPPARRHSFLIDAGAAVHAYASDITRTYASGPGDFADLIDAMETVQRDLVGRVAAGVDYRDLFLESHRAIAGVLESAGVIRASADDAVESGLSRVFYPHGLGHFLGLQVHDVAGLIDNDGEPIPRPEGHPALRLTRVLEPGNVLTVEPGLYFIDTLLNRWRAENDASLIDWARVDALRPCGGIRIEDNVLVRDGGCEDLTRRAFAEV
jgi:Xaa-Pro dipeptidase